MIETHYLACDLGAESGRLLAATLSDRKLSLREIHRFPNIPIRTADSLHWNIPNLVLELKEGLRRIQMTGTHYSSISTDSWGVDYILFNEDGEMISPTFHYRDPRTKRGVEGALARLQWAEIFEETGIQFMPINTLFQLAAEEPRRLEGSSFLLGVGDAFNYFLSGKAHIEASMASTFQLYNPRLKQWSKKMIEALRIPTRIFPPIVPSGTQLGPLQKGIRTELGLPGMEVIATCSHDTGAAVAGTPAVEPNWAYLSSGTWSLMGVEIAAPIINDKARELNFTNEIGFGNTVRFLKNLSGLWLIQECRRSWERQGKMFSYPDLTKAAEAAPPFVSLIDPSAAEFLAPSDMPAQISDFCRRTGQPVPSTEGAVVRCALESLALLYRRTLKQLEELTNTRFERLHIVGGGSRNSLLNQLSANAVQIPVIAGPAEATAIGNVLIQSISLGHIQSLADGRQIVARSSALEVFHAKDFGTWDQAAARFEVLIQPL